jgi:hypothetical protein
MTLIPDLEEQLVLAAARASGTPMHAGRRWRLTPVIAAVVAVIALLCVALISVGGGIGPASATAKVLEQFAQRAESGLSAPLLAPGQAWFTSELDGIASPWQPPATGPHLPGVAFGTQLSQTVLPSSRAVIVSRYRIENWVLANGSFGSHGGQVGRSRFYGSTADRAQWGPAKIRLKPAIGCSSWR